MFRPQLNTNNNNDIWAGPFLIGWCCTTTSLPTLLNKHSFSVVQSILSIQFNLAPFPSARRVYPLHATRETPSSPSTPLCFPYYPIIIIDLERAIAYIWCNKSSHSFAGSIIGCWWDSFFIVWISCIYRYYRWGNGEGVPSQPSRTRYAWRGVYEDLWHFVINKTIKRLRGGGRSWSWTELLHHCWELIELDVKMNH